MSKQSSFISRVFLSLLAWNAAAAASPEAKRILLAVNENSPRSRQLGDFYRDWHQLDPDQICRLRTTDATTRERESISRDLFRTQIEIPLARCLAQRERAAQVHYLVLTQGLPIRVNGPAVPDWRLTEQASVDSELTLLPQVARNRPRPLPGPLPNPYFRQAGRSFDPAAFGMLLVTRLAGYSFADAQRAVQRCRGARNRGRAVLDLKSDDDTTGNDWLRNTAILLPAERVLLDTSTAVLHDAKDVIAYASWGSNDRRRKSRRSGFTWLPGAIAAEFVSTSARTFTMPPPTWTLGTWDNSATWFAASPQSMILDYVWEGVSGISGATDEPYLGMLPRPDVLIPEYLQGRNLAESFYLAQPVLSWQVMILGDPLCRLQ